MARRKAPRIPDAILDQLLAGADPKTAFEADGLLVELKKALAERALNAEMDHHLAGEEAGNTRNGYGRKTVKTETGRIELAIPCDWQGTLRRAITWDASSLNSSGTGPVAAILANSRCETPR